MCPFKQIRRNGQLKTVLIVPAVSVSVGGACCRLVRIHMPYVKLRESGLRDSWRDTLNHRKFDPEFIVRERQMIQ